MLPNFIIGGAQKSGTTTLMNQLHQHPEIFMPVNEIGYFSNNWNKSLNWYENHFKNYNGEKAIGEKTPNYLHIISSAKRIYDTIPDIKLIFILRDPVKRAYSQYWLLKQYGDELMHFNKAVWTKSYIERGKYVEHLDRFVKLFKQSQILILTLDDLKENPVSVYQNIFYFLKVDYRFIPFNPNKKFLVGGQPKTIFLSKCAKICRFGFKMKGLSSKIVKMNTKVGYPPMNDDIKKQLYEYFKPYNDKLKNKYYIDTSKWCYNNV